MDLTITGHVNFCIKNLEKGSGATKTMRSGELLINNVVFPFVLQRKEYGKFREMANEFSTSLTVMYYKGNKTAFTRKGYVNLQLMISSKVQLWIYMKEDLLRDFFAEICVGSIKAIY